MAKLELTGFMPAAVLPLTSTAALRMPRGFGEMTVRPPSLPIGDGGRERVRQALGGASRCTLAAV